MLHERPPLKEILARRRTDKIAHAIMQMRLRAELAKRQILYQQRLSFISVYFGDGGNPSSSDEATVRVTWARATLPAGSAHEERPQSAHHLDSEVPEAGAHWGRRSSCARHCTARVQRA